MDIEGLQSYFREELPGIIINAYYSFINSLLHIPPFFYIGVIVLLLAIIIFRSARSKKAAYSRGRKAAMIKALSEAASIQESVDILGRSIKEMEPYVRTIGIYMKIGNKYTLIRSSGDINPSGTDSKNKEIIEFGPASSDFSPEQTITNTNEYNKRGRYHLYTFAPGTRNIAIRIIAYNKIDFKSIKAELGYLSVLLANYYEKEKAESELTKTRILMRSREVFSSPLFNEEMYFKFIGKLVLKANNYDNVEIDINGNKIIAGTGSFDSEKAKTLYIRNSNVRVNVYRGSGVTQDDILQTGSFLNVISAMIAFNSEEARVNYLYFLKTAVSAYENDNASYAGHAERVEAVSLAIGKSIGLSENRLEDLSAAAKLHDIGMMADMLNMSGQELSFSQKEYDMIKNHPVIGSAISTPVSSISHPVSNIIAQHHEFYDGSGYPNGISGDEILMESGILALSEVFVGYISDRPHRKGMLPEKAIDDIVKTSALKFQREVIGAFMKEKFNILAMLR
ncbi:MAG: HD domain-containing protein [Nitrospirae bacterium]|nr:HD domain-containing protein [Nitrospirota bacterium]